MVICPSCGKKVSEGKFCENCGANIENVAPVQDDMGASEVFCQYCGTKNNASNKFCESCGKNLSGSQDSKSSMKQATSNAVGGIFSNIQKSMNKATMDLLALKSDFSNNKVICKIDRIPVGQEKKIKIDEGEYAFVNTGYGYTKYDTTYTLSDTNISCAYVRKITRIAFSFGVNFDINIMKVDLEDKLKIFVLYETIIEVNDIDKFFKEMIKIKDATWNTSDVSNLINTKIEQEVSNLLNDKLTTEGGFNLKEDMAQVDKYSNEAKDIVDSILENYGANCTNFKLKNINKDMQVVNNILINNLYK